MKQPLTFLLMVSMVISSCYTHTAATKYKSNRHNQAEMVTPIWKTEADPKVKIFPYVAGIGGAAYGYLGAPNLKFDGKEIGNEANAVFYGVGSYLITRAITNYLTEKPPKKKYIISESGEWLEAYNQREGTDFEILENRKNDLLLIPANRIDSYLAEEARLAEEKRKADIVSSEKRGKALKKLMDKGADLFKEEFQIKTNVQARSIYNLKKYGIEVNDRIVVEKPIYIKDEYSAFPSFIMYFGNDNIIMHIPEDKEEANLLKCTTFDASLNGSKSIYYKCFNTYSEKVEDYIVSINDERPIVRNLTVGPDIDEFFYKSNSLEMSRLLGKTSIEEIISQKSVNILEFDKSMFSTTTESCDNCVTCQDQWGYTQGGKEVYYNTVDVYCNGEKISEWKLYTTETCGDYGYSLEDENGIRYSVPNGSYMNDSYFRIAEFSNDLCSNAKAVIRG